MRRTQITEPIECRGWKEICELLDVKDKRTARKILERLYVLNYDGKKPVLSVEKYREAVLARKLQRPR